MKEIDQSRDMVEDKKSKGKLYRVNIISPDNLTAFDIELSLIEYNFLKKIEMLTRKYAQNPCMLILHISKPKS